MRDVDFDVAIKKVTSKNPRVQAELEKEIDVLKKLKHPNIVAYYGTKIQGEEVWIIMVLSYFEYNFIEKCALMDSLRTIAVWALSRT